MSFAMDKCGNSFGVGCLVGDSYGKQGWVEEIIEVRGKVLVFYRDADNPMRFEWGNELTLVAR